MKNNTLLSLSLIALFAASAQAQWARYTIDDSSRGADGVRMKDADGDGLLDITTGWEQGGVIRVYLNPGPDRAKKSWPAVTVGEVGSPEDAVFVDLDRDGAMDVVSSCEGKTRTVYLHWAPKEKGQYLNSDAWVTEPVLESVGRQQWMYCLPLDMDGDGDADLAVGSKNEGASVGWFECPQNPRDASAWKWRHLYAAGWIMSIEAVDVNEDKRPDLLVSDRRGNSKGLLWLENPGTGRRQWREHRIGQVNRDEAMFLSAGQFTPGARLDVVCATFDREVLIYTLSDAAGLEWTERRKALPDTFGTGKAAAAADLDGDGSMELIVSCANSRGLYGLAAYPFQENGPFIDIAGKEGTKFDLLRHADLDGDGDIDILTTEEVEGFGVIWYENPAR